MFEKTYPGLAAWIEDWGWIAIGADEFSGSLVRVLDEGGMIWESPGTVKSVEKALVAADQFIRSWIEENS